MWVRLVAILLLLCRSRADVVLPFDDCEDVKLLDLSVIPGASATNVGAVQGPNNGYDVYEFSPPGSTVAVPSSALSDFKTFTVAIILNTALAPSATQTILTVGSSNLVIELEEEDDIAVSVLASGGAASSAVVGNITLGVWHTLRVSINADGAGSLFVSFDNVVIENSGTDFQDGLPIAAGQLTVSSFNGALSCLEFATASSASAPTSSACDGFAPLCNGNSGGSPFVNPPADQFCDRSDSGNCEMIFFTGTGFSQDDTYICVTEELEPNASGALSVSKTINIPASFVNDRTVECPQAGSSPTRRRRSLLQTPTIGSRRVSLFSTLLNEIIAGPVLSLVYPMMCLDCQNSLSCPTTGNGCYVTGGECFPAFAVMGSGICLPMINAFDSTPISALQHDVVVSNCPSVIKLPTGLQIINVTDGFSLGSPTLDNSAVAPLTGRASVHLFSRYDPCITADETVAEIGDAIKIIYAPNYTAKIILTFTNFADGQVKTPVIASLNLDPRRRLRRRFGSYKNNKTMRRYMKHCSSNKKKSFGRRIAFFYDPSTKDIKFFVAGWKQTVDLGIPLDNLQLVTSGRFFIRKEPFACIDLSTTLPTLTKNGKRWRGKESECHALIKQTSRGKKACLNKSTTG